MTTHALPSIDDQVRGLTAPMVCVGLIDKYPDDIGLRSMNADGSWNEWTYRQIGDQIAAAAAGLRHYGVKPGQRVLLIMRNRPDFSWLDIAAQFIRATPVSIYNSSSPEEIQYLAHHAEAEVAIVEDAGFLNRVNAVRDELPDLKHVFVINADDAGSTEMPADELYQHGSLDLHQLAAETQPDDIATLIYTSGTTGPPKGVMISQYNVVFTVESLKRSMFELDLRGIRTVSYLPMAHIAERMMGLYGPMINGYNVACCPEVSELTKYLVSVRPQLMFGVPRVWEKIYNGVNAALSADPDRQAKFNEGLQAALAIKEAERNGTATQEQLDTWDFLDAVAFKQVRSLVGLDEIQLAVSGAAPIQRVVLEWFNAIGVKLTEIYGMSESSGPMTWSPEANRPGSVGRAIPGVEVVLADDGEVICRGGVVFQGYYKEPEKTAETLVDGWLHSGDIGEVDENGYFRIVDRKKELIITSGGKNISPANLESALRSIPLIGQAAAIGDNRKYCTAILVLDPEAAAVWARKNGHEGKSLEDLASLPEIVAEVQQGVSEVNGQFAQVEQIKKFTLVGEEWLPDTDVLTPTSKLKRRGINARYATEIEAMYEGA